MTVSVESDRESKYLANLISENKKTALLDLLPLMKWLDDRLVAAITILQAKFQTTSANSLRTIYLSPEEAFELLDDELSAPQFFTKEGDILPLLEEHSIWKWLRNAY